MRPADACAAGFAAALLDPERAIPPEVAGPRGKGVVKRYNVYRNNVTVSLIEALAATFPVTERITGTEFFRAMARFHVRATPPSSPLLFEYGRDFPAYIEGYEYARGLPWLADVARIERAWLDAYHAADAEPLPAEALPAVPPERLGEIVLAAHPATRILRSRYPAVTIFAANRSDAPVGRIETTEPEDALVTRPRLDVTVRKLPPGGATFLSRLAAGEPLGVAAGAALAEAPGFDLAANVRGMLEAGAFTAIEGDAVAHERQAAGGGQAFARLAERVTGWVRVIAPPSLTQLVLRLALAVPFWRSGVNKWDGFLQLNDVAVLLFASEFKLHLPGGPYGFPAPGLFAFASGVGEIVLPLLLVLGLGTRLAALGLLLMTAVVQLTVPDGWPVHLTWAAMALGIMAWGPGRVSLDHLLAQVRRSLRPGW